MASSVHSSCVLCGEELEELRSEHPTVYVCPACQPAVAEVVQMGRSIVIGAVRKRLQRGAPTLFATMQALWRRSQEAQHE